QRQFSLFVYVSAACGLVIAVLGIIFMRPLAALLGAEGEMLENCVLYGRIILIALPAFVLQYEFQSFFVTAEKPELGLYVTVAAGVTNMVLDALLVAVFPFGLVGAAVATAVSQMAGGFVPVIYFSRENTSLLKVTKPAFDGKALLKACTNGSSEFLSNISMSVVGMLYNVQLIKYAGENGVAAYGTLMYVNFCFLAAFIGYSVGTAPIISYHFGANNTDELKNLLKKSLVIIGVFSVSMLILGEALAKPLSLMFVGYDKDLFDMTLRGFLIFSFCFLFAGVPIFGSSFFTALNNGLVSALISFLRTVVFQVAAVIIFPLIWQLDGIWLSVVGAELVAALVTIIFWISNKKKYQY
ncbi:MAG: MATE family efflux transporter, partial [Oscillospiraceae bacterium]|nr:MATE family efflux transporter [Oscillospiraceae bacterium]